MKKLLLISTLFLVAAAHAQTIRYTKIETIQPGKGKTTQHRAGTIEVGIDFISIDGVKTYLVTRGQIEAEDELYTSQECVSVSGVRYVLFYTPNKKLCDVVVKTGKVNVDYCITAL